MTLTFEQFMERQRVLADFGDLAIASDDLQEILTEACKLILRALEADFAKVLEIQKGGESLLVRAGVGWKPGIVGEMQLPMSERTSESHAIRAGRPVITNDISKEDRFEFPDFMKDHGIVAIANVPIFVPGGEAYGLLQVDSTEPREFAEEDTEFLRTYATILGPVIDRLHKVRDLEVALDTQRRLLTEMQHRIRNNIGVIIGLVRMRASSAASDETAAALTAVGQRIETLRLVHDQLYVAGTSDHLHLRTYITRLIRSVVDLFQEQSGAVQLDIEIGDFELSPEIAVPLGLIVNEFTTNSLVHGFEGKEGLIEVRVEALESNLISLCISDNGKGLPPDPPASPPGSGTGMAIINGLAGAIGAKVEWSSSPRGTMLRLDLPLT
jgi:two-component sensor histidine kinase